MKTNFHWKVFDGGFDGGFIEKYLMEALVTTYMGEEEDLRDSFKREWYLVGCQNAADVWSITGKVKRFEDAVLRSTDIYQATEKGHVKMGEDELVSEVFWLFTSYDENI